MHVGANMRLFMMQRFMLTWAVPGLTDRAHRGTWLAGKALFRRAFIGRPPSTTPSSAHPASTIDRVFTALVGLCHTPNNLGRPRLGRFGTPI